jgi:hypothetical protein
MPQVTNSLLLARSFPPNLHFLNQQHFKHISQAVSNDGSWHAAGIIRILGLLSVLFLSGRNASPNCEAIEQVLL